MSLGRAKTVGGRENVRPFHYCIDIAAVVLMDRQGYGVLSQPGAPNSLVTIRDPQEHAARRKLWDHAFTSQSLKSYEDLLARRLNQLVKAMEQRAGTVVNFADWFGFLALVLYL